MTGERVKLIAINQLSQRSIHKALRLLAKSSTCLLILSDHLQTLQPHSVTAGSIKGIKAVRGFMDVSSGHNGNVTGML